MVEFTFPYLLFDISLAIKTLRKQVVFYSPAESLITNEMTHLLQPSHQEEEKGTISSLYALMEKHKHLSQTVGYLERHSFIIFKLAVMNINFCSGDCYHAKFFQFSIVRDQNVTLEIG